MNKRNPLELAEAVTMELEREIDNLIQIYGFKEVLFCVYARMMLELGDETALILRNGNLEPKPPHPKKDE